MKTKEQWIDETIESFDGIQPAIGNQFTYEKVIQRISNPKRKYTLLQSRIFWQIAASVALLIMLNVLSVIIYNQTSGEDQSQVKSLANEYFSYIDTIKL
jgi:hypothetical protein